MFLRTQNNVCLIKHYRNLTRYTRPMSILIQNINLCRPRPNSLYSVKTCLRALATQSILGLEGFIHRRKKYEYNFKDKQESFLKKMHESCESSKNFKVYNEDLKSMIYLCQNNKKDLNLLLLLLKNYVANDQNHLAEFQFGPEIMRLYYFFKEPLAAFEIIQDQEMKKMFTQVTSYTVIMDSLFHAGYYEKTCSLFHDLLSRKLTIISLPKEPAYLASAACFKLNSEESFKETLDILSKARALNVRFEAPLYCFAAALAMNLGHYNLALELLSRTTSNSSILLNIKAMALAKYGQPQNAESILVEMHKLKRHKFGPPILKETIDTIENSYKEAGCEKINDNFNNLKQQLEKEKLINYELLDTVMCENKVDLNSSESGPLNSRDYRVSDRTLRRERLSASFSQGRKKKW